jgi:hypothetical protein
MSAKINISIDQGATYYTRINLGDEGGNPLDLTGLTAAAQMRTSYYSNNYVAFNVYTANSSYIELYMNAATTGALTAPRYLYDIDITDGTTVTRLQEGIVTVNPRVTR